MPANLTVGAALALGADPRDPNLSRIHEFDTDFQGQLVQYQLVGHVIRPRLIRMTGEAPVPLCPSRTGMLSKGKPQHLGCE
jgi:hypothetical protein